MLSKKALFGVQSMISSAIQFLENSQARWGDKTALDDSQSQFTFSELKAAALKVEAAIDPGLFRQPVAILLPKSCQSVVAYLGVLYSGNFYIPLDEKMPAERLKKILSDFEKIHIITSATFLKKNPFLADLKNTALLDIDVILSQPSKPSAKTLRYTQAIDTDPIYTIFTSGSTGVPKGVVLSHRGVIDYITWVADFYKVDENEVIGNQSPFCFDMSVLDIYVCLKTGATLKIIPELLFSFPPKLVEYLNKEKISFSFWVPTAMINLANSKLLSEINPSYLKKILFAGEVMPNKHLNMWREHFKNSLFSNLYGPTEITVTCTHYNVQRSFADNEPLPIGFARNNSELLVLTAENRVAKQDEVGELCIRGSLLALGYWNDFEKTNAMFEQNPLNKHYPEKIYRTGDLVFRNNLNELIFIGRKDNQIKHNGYRIDLGEIETAALRIANVDQVCCLYDQNNQAIVLFFESKDLKLTEAELRQGLGQYLSKYMIPTVYVKMAAIPLNANTKIDRAKLKSEYFKPKT